MGSSYKQCRINFNCDDPKEMAAYEHFKSFGRKATEYVVKLIVADLNGIYEEQNSSQGTVSNDVMERLNKIEARLSILEDSKDSINNYDDTETSSVAKETNFVQTVSDSSVQVLEEDKNINDVIPMIPADVAARLGGF